MVFFYVFLVNLVLFPLSFIIYRFLIKKRKDLDSKNLGNNEFLERVIDYFVVYFLGILGVHKFLRRKYGIGVLYLCTLGVFGIGWLIDVVRSVSSLMDCDVGDNEILKKAIYLLVVVSLGSLGVHKFAERKYGVGILYLCTLGIFGIGCLVDIVKSIRAITGLNKKN